MSNRKSFQFIPERVHSDVRISQFSRQTVPDSRSLNGETTVAEFCSRSWNKVDRSVQSADDDSRSVRTSAGSMSVDTAEPCRADTCMPEPLS